MSTLIIKYTMIIAKLREIKVSLKKKDQRFSIYLKMYKLVISQSMLTHLQ
jgi:hypothetical protein